MRFSDEEIKHQTLFRRIEAMMGETMPAGYRFDVDPDAVARAVLAKGTWAVLVLTLHIELFVQLHYRQSIEPDTELSELFKDVFMFHWKDEAQHAVLDELELKRHDATLSPEEREQAVGEFIELVVAVDSILQVQAKADAAYFAANCGRTAAAGGAGARRQALPEGLSLAVHLLGRRPSALPEHREGHDRRGPDEAHRGGPRHAHLT